MQVMPATAEAIAHERNLKVPRGEDLEDPVLNLDFGTYYLASLAADLTDGDLDAEEVGLVAAGYNAGLKRTLKWQAGEAELSAETKAYREKMMRLWEERRKARGM
jgi:soluble lytic murein transglycosylase